MAFKLALTAGHYMNTYGKRCLKTIDPNETREWWLNNRIACKIENLLANYEGVEVLRTDDTTGQKDVELKDRISAANKFGADFYLSIHHNAGINGGSGGGIMAYVYTEASTESIKWQKDLYNALVDETGLKGNRAQPLSKANLYEVRCPTMPSVLLELGFMDSKTDVPIILTDAYASKCANACVKVIVNKAGLKKKNTQKLYRVRKTKNDAKSQKGAFSNLNSAIECCNKSGDGYHVFDWDYNIVYSYKITDPTNNTTSSKNEIVGSSESVDSQLQDDAGFVFGILRKIFEAIISVFTQNK